MVPSSNTLDVPVADDSDREAEEDDVLGEKASVDVGDSGDVVMKNTDDLNAELLVKKRDRSRVVRDASPEASATGAKRGNRNLLSHVEVPSKRARVTRKAKKVNLGDYTFDEDSPVDPELVPSVKGEVGRVVVMSDWANERFNRSANPAGERKRLRVAGLLGIGIVLWSRSGARPA